jgi:2-methylcitrate dehydratase PrpD
MWVRRGRRLQRRPYVVRSTGRRRIIGGPVRGPLFDSLSSGTLQPLRLRSLDAIDLPVVQQADKLATRCARLSPTTPECSQQQQIWGSQQQATRDVSPLSCVTLTQGLDYRDVAVHSGPSPNIGSLPAVSQLGARYSLRDSTSVGAA